MSLISALSARLNRAIDDALSTPDWPLRPLDDGMPDEQSPVDVPGLDLLTERVLYATRGLIDITPLEASTLVHETLWQIAHLVRLGETVEIPELGTLRRSLSGQGYTVHYRAHPDLMEAIDA